MSYRFLKVSALYPDYLEDYHHRNPGARSLEYEGQLAALMDDGLGWADYHSRRLRELGVDARELVINDEPLNRAWREEHASRATGLELISEQIAAARPDVLFFQDPYRFERDWIESLRERVPSLRLILGWCSVAFDRRALESLRALDAVLTCALEFLPAFEKAGLRAHHLHHAFEPSLMKRITPSQPQSDFVFIGSLMSGMSGKGMHGERIAILERLLREPDLTLSLYGSISSKSALKLRAQQGAYLGYQAAHAAGFSRLLERAPVFRKVARWEAMPRPTPVSRKLMKSLQSPVYGLEMLKRLASSRIGFNSHIDCAGRYAANIRLFEVTGVGSCLLTDWKENLGDLFELDREVVAYRSAEECIEKVKWLLSHPAERAAIAEAGQRRCHREHNYEARARALHELILGNLKR